MRREDITLAVSDVGRVDSDDDASRPTLSLLLDDDPGTLARRLESEDESLSAGEIDVTVRLNAEIQDSGGTGVVAVTNSITGEYVLECNTDVETVIEFARGARQYGEATDDDALYTVELCAGDGIDGNATTVATYEKRTLLVYGESGELLREHSLIPSGVEI